jgi:hypothetical protein
MQTPAETKPAPNDSRPSGTILACSPFVFVAMSAGKSAAEALEMQAARRAEQARVSSWQVNP